MFKTKRRKKVSVLEFVNLNRDNFDVALKIQNELFPSHSAYVNYREAVEKLTDNVYWIVRHGGENIGICGLYYYAADTESAWLGWFGILKEFRRQGFGSMALSRFEEEAERRGFKFCRLYTDRFENEIAKKFYESNGYVCEQYINDEDSACKIYPIDIYSKPLKNFVLVPWGNRNINFSEQIKKQEI